MSPTNCLLDSALSYMFLTKFKASSIKQSKMYLIDLKNRYNFQFNYTFFVLKNPDFFQIIISPKLNIKTNTNKIVLYSYHKID